MTRSKRADLDTSEIRVYEHYAQASPTTGNQSKDDDTENDNDDDENDDDNEDTHTTKRPVRTKSHFQVLKNQPHANRQRPKVVNSNEQSALEAKDLANDEYFYRQLDAGVGDPAGDDVELIEPATTAVRNGHSGIGKKSTKHGIDQPDVELVQDRRKLPNGGNVDSLKRYVDNEQRADEENDAEAVAEEVDDDDDDDEDDAVVEQLPESKPRQIQFTKQFDTKADLLKEVKQIVQRNQKLTKEADGDVYWEIEYEHPKY